jgi:hypothetical protein
MTKRTTFVRELTPSLGHPEQPEGQRPNVRPVNDTKGRGDMSPDTASDTARQLQVLRQRVHELTRKPSKTSAK